MTLNDIISSGLLESYVTGTAGADDIALVNDLCKKHPALLKEIEQIESAFINYSLQHTKQPVNHELKQKIAAQLEFKQPVNTAKVIPLTNRSSSLNYYKYGIAASTLLFISSSIYIVSLHKKMDRLHNRISQLSNEKSYLADEMTILQTSNHTLNNQFQIASNPGFKHIELKGMNSLINQTALVLWNNTTNEVYFNAAVLPLSPSGKQYQLWAIIDGKPVDAGTIDAGTGNTFQRMKLINGAQAFAVTIERKGGSLSPTLETMCLLGNA